MKKSTEKIDEFQKCAFYVAAIMENLKKIRRRYSFNQDEFASIVGVCRATISKWERGVSAPTIYQAMVLHIIERASWDFETRKKMKSSLYSEGPIQSLYYALNYVDKLDRAKL